jgi:hypothetical protein
MYLLIRYPVGVIVEAVVLKKGNNRMRVAVAGFPDAIELTRSGAQWFAPNHEPIEFEFLMSETHPVMSVPAYIPANVALATGARLFQQ